MQCTCTNIRMKYKRFFFQILVKINFVDIILCMISKLISPIYTVPINCRISLTLLEYDNNNKIVFFEFINEIVIFLYFI